MWKRNELARALKRKDRFAYWSLRPVLRRLPALQEKQHRQHPDAYWLFAQWSSRDGWGFGRYRLILTPANELEIRFIHPGSTWRTTPDRYKLDSAEALQALLLWGRCGRPLIGLRLGIDRMRPLPAELPHQGAHSG